MVHPFSTIYPTKLKKGDEIRVIAPARSLTIVSDQCRNFADKHLVSLGIKVTYGKHVSEVASFDSASIAARVEDLHEAFRDPKVKALITVIGGYNSNQLLRSIDWELIRANPKIFCGYSDITVLNNALFAKTGLVSYSGPHYSTFGQKEYLDFTLSYFQKCLFTEDTFSIQPSDYWSDDPWFINQDKRDLIKNEGFWLIAEGETEGTILGGNLCSLNLLQGTGFFPKLKEPVVLFLEDSAISTPMMFDRDLQSLLHAFDGQRIVGMVIGRFQKASKMSQNLLTNIIHSKKELKGIPIVANLDFGHTDPKMTFPIGGSIKIYAYSNKLSLDIGLH